MIPPSSVIIPEARSIARIELPEFEYYKPFFLLQYYFGLRPHELRDTRFDGDFLLKIDIDTGNEAVNCFFKGNIKVINDFLMALAEEQIKAAFEQSEKEVTDLHSRISQGIREAKRNGTQIGLVKGTELTTKKSLECKAIIKKHSKDFGGTLDDPDVMKLCGCSRNSYYKYKREIKGHKNG